MSVNHVTLLVLFASMVLNTVVNILAQKITIFITTCVLTLVQKDSLLTTLPKLVILVTIHVLAVLNLLDNVVVVNNHSSSLNNNV
jgi:hypothetical protein